MESQVVRCAACGQANRIPALAEGKSAVCGKCRAPLAASASRGPVVVSDATFREAIAQGAWIVDFWAAWCGPCRMIAPILDQLATERNHVRIGKLNVDENPRTAAAFRVQGIPLLVFFVDGVERGRITGAVPKSEIEGGIARFLGR